MRLSEIKQSNAEEYLDRLRYKDYFDQKDNAFSVILYNKVWKSFPTLKAAELAALNYNKKVGRILATVREN